MRSCVEKWDVLVWIPSLYLPKSQVKIEYFLFVSTHVPSSSFMDSFNSVSLSLFTGASVIQNTLFGFFLCSCPSSSFQYQLTVPIPFGTVSFFPIVATVLDKMGSILSVKMYSFDHFCALSYLSTITLDPSQPNQICCEYSTIADSICHILFFEILQWAKGLFLMCPLGGFFLPFQLILIEFSFYCLVLHFCIEK